MSTRRNFLQHTATLAAGLLAVNRAEAAGTHTSSSSSTTQIANTGGYLGVSSGSLSKVDHRTEPVMNTPVVTTDGRSCSCPVRLPIPESDPTKASPIGAPDNKNLRGTPSGIMYRPR